MPTQFLAAEVQEMFEAILDHIDKQEGVTVEFDQFAQASIKMTIGAVDHFLHTEANILDKKTWEIRHAKDRQEHIEKSMNALIESSAFLEKAKRLFDIPENQALREQLLNIRSNEFRYFMLREKELLLASGYSDRKVNDVVDYIIKNLSEIKKPVDFTEVRNRLDWLSRKLKNLLRENPQFHYLNKRLLFESLSYVTGGISIVALNLVTEPYIGTTYAAASAGTGGSMILLASSPLVKMFG